MMKRTRTRKVGIVDEVDDDDDYDDEEEKELDEEGTVHEADNNNDGDDPRWQMITMMKARRMLNREIFRS